MRTLNWSGTSCARDRHHYRLGGTWDDFINYVTEITKLPANLERHEAKLSLPAIIPAVWAEGFTHREAIGVSHYDVIGMDIDNSEKSFYLNDEGEQEVIERIPASVLTPRILIERAKEAGLASVGHETFSSTPKWPKCRVYLPLERSITPSELPFAVEYLLRMMRMKNFPFGCDLKTMNTIGRIYFLPGTQGKNLPLTWTTKGKPLTLPKNLTSLDLTFKQPNQPNQPNQTNQPSQSNQPNNWYKNYSINLTTLNIYDLLKHLGAKPGKPVPYRGGFKARCHCPWEAEHGNFTTNDDATIYWGEDRWPNFSCSHSHHKGLPDLCQLAGNPTLMQFATQRGLFEAKINDVVEDIQWLS